MNKACLCWRTTWERMHMSDGEGNCKHCGGVVSLD